MGEGGERRGDLEDDGGFFESEGGLGGELVGEGVVPVKEEGEGRRRTADCQLGGRKVSWKEGSERRRRGRWMGLTTGREP